MLNSLDPYTEFESQKEAADMRESVSGKYGGVGLVISGPIKSGAVENEAVGDGDEEGSETSKDPKKKVEVRVVNAMEGYAYDAGMRVGDRILAVNEKSVDGLTAEEVSMHIILLYIFIYSHTFFNTRF